MRDTLRAWLLANVSSLPFGGSYHQIDCIPFRFGIQKQKEPPGFSVARWVPPGLDINDDLITIVAAALNNKNDQLQKYHAKGDITILIFESDDIALANHVLLYKAFLQASTCVSTVNIDQVWLAETIDSEDFCTFLCFRGPDSIMERINPRSFLLGASYADYWWTEIRREKVQQKIPSHS